MQTSHPKAGMRQLTAVPPVTKKIKKLVSEITNIEWIVVGSELEALLLEMNLIKKHRPHYNVRLKDDKRFPYIKVKWGAPLPKVTVTRRMIDDGSKYFGPYFSVWAVHKTLDVVRKIFPYLTCDREITGEDNRACLYHDIKLCTAPCIGKVSKEEYRLMIKDLMKFLNGRTEEITERLELEMSSASDQLHYEKAATIRDQLDAIEKVVKKQRVYASEYTDSDVVAIARSEREACVQVFFIRGGKMIGREYFMMEGTEEIHRRILRGEFPEYIVKQFIDVLDYFGQSPIIVRSSSLLEDNFGNAFAGKYESIFCANQGRRYQRLEGFISAIRCVYASLTHI